MAFRAFSDLPFEEGGEEQWKSSMRIGFDKLKSKTPDDQEEYLIDLVKALNRKFKSDRTDDIRQEATQLLIAIPGHAKKYQIALNSAEKKLKENKDYFDEYMKAQDRLTVLAYMPSAESVAVLGELVNDPVGRDGKSILGGPLKDSDSWFPVNASIAAQCLANIGIANGPKTSTEIFQTDWESVDKWKDWWDEIKKGQRTYRFVGSSIEYGPDGPVPAKELQRRERERQREAASGNYTASNQQETQRPIAESKRKWTAIFVSSFAGLLLLIASWKVLSKPNRAD